MAAFVYAAEWDLLRIRTEWSVGILQFNPSHTIAITEPKRRLISAAPYRDGCCITRCATC